MNKVSTNLPALLVLLLLLGTTSYSQNQPWPLKGRIDLSSGFGDFRANRFHAGVDLRTGGAVGKKVYSPVDGYIWRVKMSYRGYGKGLYIKGDDGHFYVLAHLSKFIDAIQQPVWAEQYAKERYYVDIHFKKDQIRVKQGQQVAWSGQTGIGAPHLHFEKRSPDNVPINPLSHGFTLDDTTPPTFERIGFHLLDNHSLFPTGRRKMFFPVRKVREGEFVLDTVLYLTSPFGVLAHCYDQKRPGGMRQAVKKLTLLIDDEKIFEDDVDSLPYEDGYRVNLVYDPVEAANGEKRVRWLHGYDETNTRGHRSDLTKQYAVGRRRGLITASDARGNVARIAFEFDYQPSEMQSDLGLGDQPLEIPERGNGRAMYSCESDGCVLWFETDTVDEYAFFRPGPMAPETKSTLRSKDLEYGSLRAALRADGIALSYLWAKSANLVRSVDERFTLASSEATFLQPHFIAIDPVDSDDLPGRGIASPVYRLSPDALPLRNEFTISIALDADQATNKQTGLCWYDKKEQEWVWIDDETENDDLAAGPSLGGGLFAAIIDTTAPTIRKLNLKRGHKYWNKKPRVKCVIEDNLSGFENDLSIDCRVDGHWVLPELDTESGDFVGLMREPLSLGKHELTISVIDRAGNRTERRVEFDVIKRSN